MRWRNFAVVLFVVMILQVSLGRALGLGPQRIMPDLLLMTAVVLAFRGPAGAGLIACWFLGLAKDLTSEALLGSYALAFGLAALLVLWLRDLLYADNTLGLMLLTFAMVILVEYLALEINILRGQMSPPSGWGVWAEILFSALLTGALVPYGQWVLLKLRHWIGLEQRSGTRM